MTISVTNGAIGLIFASLLLTHSMASTAQGKSKEEARLKALMSDGRLKVEPTLEVPLADGRVLSLVRVDVAPGVTEPSHTHPGTEVLYGLTGNGYVTVEKRTVAIRVGEAVHVEMGKAKAISNPSRHPLSVLAVLILDPAKPVLEVVDKPSED